MTKITYQQIKLTEKIIVNNAYTNRRERPDFLSKLDFRYFKKFGYAKCLWCKEHFIKHRNEQFYCTAKCRVYHFRKMKREKS